MTASRIVLSLFERFERSVLGAIGTQSLEARGEIKQGAASTKTPPLRRRAALFRMSEYMMAVIPWRAPLWPLVMPGLVPGIDVLRAASKTWMAGT
ncbi:hypothetical protein [Bradyrhizobium stylosanthis]|uniref:hypothetical protein n=1 Tax=Bradyrhizobium stylosanthis TaxID=1803665 RepID=UPI00119ED520|nr:hypothetical protein [Bradyrhizobium stylosanthis]